MRDAAVLLAAIALVACNREKTYDAPSAAGAAQAGETWVAQPGNLSPEQTRTLQRALIDRGFAVELSGMYDAQTTMAVSDFQRSRGLPATGNVNSDTAAALGLDPNQVTPVRGGPASESRAGGESAGPDDPATSADPEIAIERAARGDAATSPAEPAPGVGMGY